MKLERNSRRRLRKFYLSEAQVKMSYIIWLYVYSYNKLNLAHILLFVSGRRIKKRVGFNTQLSYELVIF